MSPNRLGRLDSDRKGKSTRFDCNCVKIVLRGQIGISGQNLPLPMRHDCRSLGSRSRADSCEDNVTAPSDLIRSCHRLLFLYLNFLLTFSLCIGTNCLPELESNGQGAVQWEAPGQDQGEFSLTSEVLTGSRWAAMRASTREM